MTIALVLLGTRASFQLFAKFVRFSLAVTLAIATPIVLLMAGSELIAALGHYEQTWMFGLIVVVFGAPLVVNARATGTPAITGEFRSALGTLRSSGPLGWASAGVILIVVVITAIVGIATAPNNMDSLNYHLPRVMQWLQSGDFSHFASPYPSQLYTPAGSEAVNGILLEIFRTDHAMFLTQWIGLILLVASVITTCRNLGISISNSLLAGAFAASAPLIVGEAATTQNDLISGAFVVAALACITTNRSISPDRERGWMLAMLASPVLLGASIAVKPTCIVFVIPVAVWQFAVLIKSGRRVLALVALIALTSALALNAGWMIRNQNTFDSARGPDAGITITSNYATALLLNSVKNLGHNLAVPAPASVNTKIASALGKVAATVSGTDLNDRRFSYTVPYSVDSERNEDRAANLIQAIAILLAAIACIGIPAARRRSWPLVASLVFGYLLFAALFSYQEWAGRLLLTSLAFGAILVAVALENIRTPRRQFALAWVVLVLCALQMAPWLLAQKWRPLISTRSVLIEDDYSELTASFPNQKADDWRAAIDYISSLSPAPTSIAFAGENSYSNEYVWWRYLKSSDSVILFHEGSSNFAANRAPDVRPDVVLSPVGPIDARPGYESRQFGKVTVLTVNH